MDDEEPRKRNDEGTLVIAKTSTQRCGIVSVNREGKSGRIEEP